MRHLGRQLQLERERLKRDGPDAPVEALRKREKDWKKGTSQRAGSRYARELEQQRLREEQHHSMVAAEKILIEERSALIRGAHQSGSPVCLKIQHSQGLQHYEAACSKALTNVIYSIYQHEVTCPDCLVMLDWSLAEGLCVAIEDQVVDPAWWNKIGCERYHEWDEENGQYREHLHTLETWRERVLMPQLKRKRALDFPERAEEHL